MVEACLAALAALRLMFQSADGLPPCIVIIIIVYPSDAEALGVPLAFGLANLVLLLREDVRVEVVYHRAYIMRQQPLHDGRGAWCATRM